MAYCRWSTDNFRCDLYCYESVGGYYATHVANMKWKEGYPLDPPAECYKNGRYSRGEDAEADRLYDETDRKNEQGREPIGGPHDGESFRDDTLEEFRDRLKYLRKCGYRFPKEVFDAIDEEIKERDESNHV